MKGKDFETTYPAPFFFADEKTWTLKVKTLILDYPFIYRREARIQVSLLLATFLFMVPCKCQDGSKQFNSAGLSYSS